MKKEVNGKMTSSSSIDILPDAFFPFACSLHGESPSASETLTLSAICPSPRHYPLVRGAETLALGSKADTDVTVFLE